MASLKQSSLRSGIYPPLGFDIKHRKLVPNKEEVRRVIEIFELHLEMRSGYQLAQLLNERGDRNKRWVNRHGVESGGQRFSYQAIYKILNNPLYIGKITHKDNVYEGQHEGIVPLELWKKVQAALKEGKEDRATRHAKHGMLLMGKCVAPSGEVYTPTYSKKGNRHYRYYICKSSQHRIKAQDLERLVIDTIRMLARQPKHWLRCWQQSKMLVAKEAQHKWERLWAGWPESDKEHRQKIVRAALDRIVVTDDQLTVRMGYQGICETVENIDITQSEAKWPREKGYVPKVELCEEYLEITIPARFEMYGKSQVAVDAEGQPIRAFKRSNYNQVLVNALVRSYQWNQQVDNGKTSITELAKREGRNRTHISRVVNLMYLAPDIMASILNGSQPETLHLKDLMRVLPIEWGAQKRALNFPDSAQ